MFCIVKDIKKTSNYNINYLDNISFFVWIFNIRIVAGLIQNGKLEAA